MCQSNSKPYNKPVAYGYRVYEIDDDDGVTKSFFKRHAISKLGVPTLSSSAVFPYHIFETMAGYHTIMEFTWEFTWNHPENIRVYRVKLTGTLEIGDWEQTEYKDEPVKSLTGEVLTVLYEINPKKPINKWVEKIKDFIYERRKYIPSYIIRYLP